jgi:4-hydroxy-tetrahydrodipicolinate synthase
MVLPPMRYVPDHRELVAYFKAIANSTDLPIMLYNNPVDYKTLITLDAFEDLTQCSNIMAVKESTRDVTNLIGCGIDLVTGTKFFVVSIH